MKHELKGCNFHVIYEARQLSFDLKAHQSMTVQGDHFGVATLRARTGYEILCFCQ